MGGLLLPYGQTRIVMSEESRQLAIDVAFRVTMSEHEWEWTNHEQATMAEYCLWAFQRLEIIEQVSGGEEFKSKES